MNREFDRRQKKISVLNIFTNLKLRKFSDANKIWFTVAGLCMLAEFMRYIFSNVNHYQNKQ